MHPIPAFAMILALAAPLAAASAQPPEPMLGRGIDLAIRDASAPAGARPATAQPPFGVRLDYGGARGTGIRVSTMADNAFGATRDESTRRVGQAPATAATAAR